MSEIINYSDRKPAGTFSQLKLADDSRILISLTKHELAIFKLILRGSIPIKKIFKHNISEFIDFFSVRIEQIGFNGSFLEAVVNYLLGCESMEDVIKKMNAVVAGYNDPTIKEEVHDKLRKQVHELFVKETGGEDPFKIIE